MTATTIELRQPTATAATPPPDRRRWWALAVLALAQFLVVLDASIVNIAIPSIGTDLGLSPAALTWVITAYVLPFGSLLLLGGRLADRHGHRRLFLAGIAGFTAASVIAGLAPTGEVLLVARALQGASAALLAPASLALVTRLFTTESDRAKALGIWGAVAGIGSAAGVLLGGVLTAAFGWQAVFFVNVPVGILVLATIPVLVRADAATARGRLDLPGAALVTSALVALVSALSAAEPFGFGHPLVLGLLAASAVLFAALVVVERRSDDPLVPVALFANRGVLAGNLVMLLVGAAMVALFFALSVYLQDAMGFDALTAGLSQLPLAGALVVAAGAVAPAITRFGLRPVLAASLVVVAGGLGWLAAAPVDADFALHLLAPTVLIGLGLGGAFVSTTQLAVQGVAGGEAGAAGGLVNTSQQIGGAVGMATLPAIGAAITTALLDGGADAAAASVTGFSAVFAGAGALALAAAAITLLLRDRR